MPENAKRILVVEDNTDIREYMAMMLRLDGYDVLEAENGRDALNQLEEMKAPPCLILLDLMMPVMSGPELLSALREHRRFADLPVVVLSAGARSTEAPEVRKFLRKPADPQLVLAAVHEICGMP